MKFRFVCLSLATILTSFAASPPKQVDGETVYRDNCTRCHIAFRNIPIRALPAVVHHMQVRALLTGEERTAVLRYLLETSASAHTNRPTPGEKKP